MTPPPPFTGHKSVTTAAVEFAMDVARLPVRAAAPMATPRPTSEVERVTRNILFTLSLISTGELAAEEDRCILRLPHAILYPALSAPCFVVREHMHNNKKSFDVVVVAQTFRFTYQLQILNRHFIPSDMHTGNDGCRRSFK